MNTAVLILPNQHWLDYGSCVMRKIADQFMNRLTIIELNDGDAMPDNINAAIQQYDPIFVFGVGHGNVNIYTVECMTPYMMVCSDTTRMMAGRVIHLNSCLTAQQLGRDLIAKGTITYYGNYEEFVLIIGRVVNGVQQILPPCSDKLVTTVFDAEYAVEKSLFSGSTTGQAQQARLKAYDDEINYWTTGPGASDPAAPYAVRALEIDKSIAVMYGSDNAVVATPIPTTLPFAALLAAVAGLGIGIVMGSTTPTGGGK
jgi:hypothetical protein